MQTIRQVLISVNAEGVRNRTALCGQTEGISPHDLEEIQESARSFQVPADGRFDILNLFFHHLPSGAYALGRLTPAMETSQRKEARIHSFFLQYLIIDSETLLAFGNNPIFLYQEILSGGQLPFVTRETTKLEPIVLSGVRKWFDENLITGMTDYPGAVPLAVLAGTALHSLSSLFTGGPPPIHLLSALFNLFPLQFRPELTFSTGLYFAPDRYFRLIGVSKKNPHSAHIRDFCPIPYLNLDQMTTYPDSVRPQNGWGRLIAEVLESGRFDFFQKRIVENYFASDTRSGEETLFIPSAEDLDALADRWFEDLRRLEKQDNSGETEIKTTSTLKKTPPKSDESSSWFQAAKQNTAPEFITPEEVGEIFHLKKRKDDHPLPPLSVSEKLRRWLLANDPEEEVLHYRDQTKSVGDSIPDHTEGDESPLREIGRLPSPPERPQLEDGGISRRGRIPLEEPLLVYTEKNRLFSPFQRLLADYPEREKDLLELDSRVSHALRGDDRGGEELTRFWKTLKTRLDRETEWTVREEYIHFIQAKLTFDDDGQEIKSPRKSLAALDVLDLFLNEGQPTEFSFGMD